jgi:Ca-activated chloride channel family protein
MIHFRFFSFPALKSFCITLALALPCLLFSAQTTFAQDPGEVVTVNTSLVQLNVGVVDRQGRAVTNLSRTDFKVYEDGVLQPITDFEPTATPFSLVLMLDLSGSTLTFRETLKQAAYRFLDALAPEDRVAVVGFNEKAKTLEGFTSDFGKIVKSIKYADGKGETHFYQALDYALNLLAKEGKRRKAIVVLTDGLDTEMRKQDRELAANAHTNEEAIASVKPDASGPLNQVLRAADRQGVTIYPLALPSGDPKHLPFIDPVLTAIYNSAHVRMQTLADRTGGRLGEIKRLEDMGWLYAQVAADLRSLYTIAYSPTNTDRTPGRWRAIRIEAASPDLITHTKTGYVAR